MEPSSPSGAAALLRPSLAALLRLCFDVQLIDDRLFALRIFLTLETIVGSGELHVRFDQIGRILDDAFEQYDGFVHFAGLQAQGREQLARSQVPRANRCRALDVCFGFLELLYGLT